MVKHTKNNYIKKFKVGDKIKAVKKTIHSPNQNISYGFVKSTSSYYCSIKNDFVQLINIDEVRRESRYIANATYLCSSYDFELILTTNPKYEIW